jgi:hypothetical protein
MPLEVKQLEAPTGLPENEQPTSPVENPEPDTWTIDPAELEIGLSAIEGLLTIEVVV